MEVSDTEELDGQLLVQLLDYLAYVADLQVDLPVPSDYAMQRVGLNKAHLMWDAIWTAYDQAPAGQPALWCMECKTAHCTHTDTLHAAAQKGLQPLQSESDVVVIWDTDVLYDYAVSLRLVQLAFGLLN